MTRLAFLRRCTLAGLASASLAACSVFSKSPPVELHYVTTEGMASAPPPVEPPQGSKGLRLGQISSSAHLRHRMVYREGDLHLGTYDQWRWTENPEEYVRRALSRALFQEHSLRRVLTRSAPTLDLEVVAFEEVRRGSARSGRVKVLYTLRDDRSVLAVGEVVAEETSTSDRVPDIVGAIAKALARVTTELSETVVGKLPELSLPVHGPREHPHPGHAPTEPSPPAHLPR